METLSAAADQLVSEFVGLSRQKPANGSRQVADRTLQLLRQLVAEPSWRQTSQLLGQLRAAGRRLSAEMPTEPAVGTLVCRLLKMARDEHEAKRRGQLSQEDSLHRRLTAGGPLDAAEDLSQEVAGLRADLLAALDELQTELDASADNIAREALGHIHADDVVLTAGHSRTVLEFLRRAARERAFHVIVAEGAPFCRGHEAARALAALPRVQVTVIAESAVFAMMARVNKVILGAQTVLADGGLRAACGTHALALAARFHSVPVIVCAPSYKLSPQFHRGDQQEGFQCQVSPEPVLSYAEGAVVGRARLSCPVYDYVPPELVTLFVTHTGGTSPWYIYRLLNEYYDQQDHEIVQGTSAAPAAADGREGGPLPSV
ncbi:translation initiation factor eIF-2B subunit beta-like [Pollicipes pollicipes]|uniref:translation initiation factor eIF-2B subunit beta-like n=1 Tax=Pollicipes pollicipes TaxID=41117 RepID=UPI0018851EB3|nr:translation initiation factor eIF-2B subunit beta-like [Pollicipes pollicipes]